MSHISIEDRLTYLRQWWEKHGSSAFESADDWINSLTNVELLEALTWIES